MPMIRVLDNTRKSMERLGYLKRLAKRVSSSHTSNLENIGADLIDTITAKVRVQLDSKKAEYIRRRLDDPIYHSLRVQATEWLAAQEKKEPLDVVMELQDLYLADPALPSQTGKLVKDDWNRYPVLGLRLGLMRAGTYSATTRTLSILHLSGQELPAFLEYKSEINPLKLSPQQATFFLYILLENDGEVIAPLFSQLSAVPSSSFTDHDAGNLLPEIYQNIIGRHQRRMLPVEARERLTSLEKLARSVTRIRVAKKLTGSSIRDQVSRVRVEPYVDIGLLVKADHFNHEYSFSSCGLVWVEALKGIETSEDISELISKRFFSIAAKACGLDAVVLKDTSGVIPHMIRAWEAVNSPGGYAPIEELALLGGIKALFEHNIIIDPAVAREAIIDYQKQNPYKVRFTVNRQGVLAHVRFIE